MLTVWIVLACLALLVLLLAVPVELSYAICLRTGERSARGQVSWFFGLVRVKLPTQPDVRSSAERTPSPRRSEENRRRSKKRSSRQSPLAMLSVEGAVQHLVRLLNRLLSGLHVQELEIRGRLGLGDPADTGQIWALVGPLSVLLDTPRVSRVDFQPDFAAEVFEFSSQGRMRAVPLEYLGVILRFALSPITFRMFRAMR